MELEVRLGRRLFFLRRMRKMTIAESVFHLIEKKLPVAQIHSSRKDERKDERQRSS